jgi:predicted alpha/beta-hydrolase family hydrolase
MRELSLPGFPASASLHGAGGTVVVLGHGAGGNRRNPLLLALAEAL